MKCQYCSCIESKVVDSRPADDNRTIRRRRVCLNCGRRFTTYEKIEVQQVLVIKRDQSRELFDPQKVRSGIIAACHKRPVTAAQIEKLVAEVEQFAANSLQPEITSTQIGEMVMEGLRTLDEVAYVRFASVYRQFTDIPSFMEELNRLVRDSKDN